MDKTQVLSEIMIYIEQVKGSGNFKGRARLIMSLVKMYDMVNLHEESIEANKIIYSLAKGLMKTFQAGLNGGK